MRCQNCQYPLWNLRTRNCPECGEAFAPGDFEFIANTVRFCCPHCDQEYYGTSTKGHLEPREFDCVACSNHISMDEMVLRPAAGFDEHETVVDPLPWTERARRGRFKAFMATIGWSMVAPVRLGRRASSERGSGDAWLFAFIVLLVCSFLGAGIPLLIIGALMRDIEPVVAGLVVTGTGVIGIPILMAIWGAFTHGMLLVTGGAKHGIGTTYKALCFATGPLMLMAVPCVGWYCIMYIALAWWLVSACLLTMVMQQVHGGRATLAVCTLPGLGVLLTFGGYAVGMYFMLQSATFQSAMTIGPDMNETDLVRSAILDFAAERNGQAPPHALHLIANGNLVGADMWLSSTDTTEGLIPAGESTLLDFEELEPDEMWSIAGAEAQMLGPDVTAHRLGDFVFTYHGLDLTKLQGNEWVVIAWPDPVINGPTEGLVLVAMRWGSVDAIPAAEFAAELERQNALRAENGLPLLPHPQEVLQREVELNWQDPAEGPMAEE